MSLDAMMKVTQAEQAGQQRKAEAAATAKKMIAEAEQAGALALVSGRQKAEEEVASLMATAEASATQQSTQIMAQTQANCDALRKGAESRMAQAAQLIVGRVVNI